MKLIGVCGGSGSGKTTLVQALQTELGVERLEIISQDSYYKHHPHLSFQRRCELNFDHPEAIDYKLFEEHLLLLQSGQSVKIPTYSFETHLRNDHTQHITPKEIRVVEGILIFSNPKLFSLLDYSIYIESDENTRLQRRIARDLKERGRSIEEVTSRFRDTIKPMHDLFIEPHKKNADCIFDNSENDFSKIQEFCKAIISLIK